MTEYDIQGRHIVCLHHKMKRTQFPLIRAAIKTFRAAGVVTTKSEEVYFSALHSEEEENGG